MIFVARKSYIYRLIFNLIWIFFFIVPCSSSSPLDLRLCLVGNLSSDSKLRSVAETFGVPIVNSENGQEYAQDDSSTIFVLENFEGDVYNSLYKSKQPILGPAALQQLALRKEKLPSNTRPLFNLAMTGVVVCFTGFRNKEDLVSNFECILCE